MLISSDTSALTYALIQLSYSSLSISQTTYCSTHNICPGHHIIVSLHILLSLLRYMKMRPFHSSFSFCSSFSVGLLKCPAENPCSCCDALANYAWNLESFCPSSSVGLLQMPSKTYAFCAMLWWIMHEINTNVLPTLIQLLLFLFFSPLHLSVPLLLYFPSDREDYPPAKLAHSSLFSLVHKALGKLVRKVCVT